MPLRPCLGSSTHPPGHTLTTRSRCPDCQRDTDRARGTTTQRGYGADHQAERTRWTPHVAAGQVDCARCGERIQPDEAWDLGHTDDRRGYTGPEHANQCNRSAGGSQSRFF